LARDDPDSGIGTLHILREEELCIFLAQKIGRFADFVVGPWGRI
jgi:hypothetical protein